MKKKILTAELVLVMLLLMVGATGHVNGEENQLIIEKVGNSSFVMEGKNFWILVTCNDVIIEDVKVDFLEDIYYTTLNGTGITVPLVDT